LFQVPKLTYAYDALEPAISAEIMKLHHDVHHEGYVSKLNAALEGHEELQGLAVEEILRRYNSLPSDIQTAVRNNGGGHYNHSLFWVWMSPNGGGEPTGELYGALVEKYGSIQAFKEEFSNVAKGLFGSGWVWLQPDLSIVPMPNQDSPLIFGGKEPILGLDVWEHAYYLDYKNKRADYIDAWWSIVEWRVVEARYARF